jgi:hypothetical protein
MAGGLLDTNATVTNPGNSPGDDAFKVTWVSR